MIAAQLSHVPFDTTDTVNVSGTPKSVIRLLLVVSLLTFAAIFPPMALSQEEESPESKTAITISPAIIEKKLRPLEQDQQVIRIYNNTEFALPTSVSIATYSIDDKGIPQFSEEYAVNTAVTWLTLDITDCILEPKSFKEVTVSISIPEGARKMSHFAAVMFQPVLPQEYFLPHSAHVVPYIAAILSFDIISDNTKPPSGYLKISDFKTSPDTKANVLGVSAELQNKDVYFHRVKNTLHVFNIFGDKVLEKELIGITLYPEMDRIISDVVTDDLSFGWYSAQLITEDQNEVTTAQSSFFVKPQFLEIIAIIAVLSANLFLLWLLFIFLFRRKKLFNGIRALLGRPLQLEVDSNNQSQNETNKQSNDIKHSSDK